jgi:hypothetical protein
MSEFAKSNPAFDKKIAESNDVQDVLEACRTFVAPATQPEPSPSLPAAPQQDAKLFRVIYPFGNSRFEIYGVSEADLDQQEKRIREMYGQQ